MATLQSKLILSLIDRVTGPSKAINQALSRMQSSMDRTRTQLMDAVGVGYLLARSLSAPIKAAVEFETQLENIGQKAGIPRERLAALGAEMRKIGNLTNQSGTKIAEGMDTLLGLGASEGDALAMLPAISKTSVAYQASMADLSNAGFAALDNLKVPAKEFSRALDAMAQSGKSGAFELKDMAQYMPALSAGYQALGQTGVPAVADLAAALQITRKGAGDSAEAATNLRNVLQKIKAPQTVAAFKKMGVNLERELKKASKRGLTPIEAIAEITNKTLKGDLSKLGDLFSDAQVQQGLRPLIQNIELYRKIRAEAMAAQGVVEADYERRLKTSAGALMRMKATLDNLSVSVGTALLPALNAVIDKIAPVVQSITELAERYPQLTSAIIGTTAALVGLRVGFLALKFAGLFAATGILAAAGRLLVLAGTIGRILKLGTGLGLLLTGIGLAGSFIYKNWSGISTMFAQFGRSFMQAIQPLGPILQRVIDGARRLYDWVSKLVGPVDGLGASWFQMGHKAGKAVGDALVAVVKLATELPGKIAAIDWSALGNNLKASLAAIDFSGTWSGLVNSAKTAIASLRTSIITGLAAVDWSGLGTAIKASLSAIDFGGMWSGLVSSAVSAVQQVRASITSGLSSIDWSAIGKSAGAAVTGALSKIAAAVSSYDWSSLGATIGAGLASAWAGLSSIQTALIRAIVGGDGGAGIASAISTALGKAITNINWIGVGAAINNAIVAGIKANLSMLNGMIKGAFKIDLAADGAKAIQSLWDGMSAKFNEFIAWVKTIPQRIIAAIGNIDLSNIVKLPSMPNLGANTSSNPSRANANSAVVKKVDGAKARGGPVWPGGNFLVGERGPELFSPSRAGVITPNNVLTAGRSAGVTNYNSISAPVTITVTGAVNPAELAGKLGEHIKAAVESADTD